MSLIEASKLKGIETLNSDQLKTLQVVLDKTMRRAIKTMDYEQVAELAIITDAVDNSRRDRWHSEKFGPYEQMADMFFDENDKPLTVPEGDFASDDIPF